jgi:hypothetical protein
MSFAVLVPVGPSQTDLERVPDLLDSLLHFEGGAVRHLILLDDSPAPRGLERLVPPSHLDVHLVRISLGRRRLHQYQAIAAGTLAGLSLAGRLGVEAVLRLDTDSLVVGPFAAEILAAFRDDPGLGIVGSYDTMCNGDERDWSPWVMPIRLATLPLPVVPGHDGARPAISRPSVRRAIRRRRQLRRAKRNGYRLGEHCLGGGYAANGRLAAWLTEPANLRQSAAWLDSRIGDDAIIGLVARAAGFSQRGMVAGGRPFALAFVGLPAPPKELVEMGAGIVHSVKNDAIPEREVRRVFAGYRTG